MDICLTFNKLYLLVIHGHDLKDVSVYSTACLGNVEKIDVVLEMHQFYI